MRRRGNIAAGLVLALACGAEPGGRGAGDDEGDGKADAESTYDPALSDHRNAVRACLAEAVRARADSLEDAESELLNCLSRTNDTVWSLVQRSLPDAVPDPFTAEPIPTRGGEVDTAVQRLRSSQSLVCDVFGSVLGGGDADDASFVQLRCLAASELHTANLIDAYLELDGERVEVTAETERSSSCEQVFDDRLDEGFAEPDGTDPEAPRSEREWFVGLHHERRDCMKSFDAERRVRWATDLEFADKHAGDDFHDRMRVVTRALERESRAGRLLCGLFAYQGTESHALTEALCMADSTLQASVLFDDLQVAPDVPEPSDPQDPERPPPVPEPDPNPMPAPQDGTACYPGPEGTWDVCIPLVYPESPPSGYRYPSALGGNANYREPLGFIDLDAVDGSTRLSANFTLAEVAHRWKGRYAVVQPHAIASLQKLRDEVGSIHVNSGYRSPDYNDGVGGATYSRHMYGDGFDMDPGAVPLSELEDACQAIGGFLVEYTSHVHCDFRFDAVDESFFGDDRD